MNVKDEIVEKWSTLQLVAGKLRAYYDFTNDPLERRIMYLEEAVCIMAKLTKMGILNAKEWLELAHLADKLKTDEDTTKLAEKITMAFIRATAQVTDPLEDWEEEDEEDW